MSRTHRNAVRQGICSGNNTEFYRNRRKKERRVNRNHLKNVVNTTYEDDIDDNLNFEKIPTKDDWNEPTDGSILIDNDKMKQMLRECNNTEERHNLEKQLKHVKYTLKK